jgi:hypothetical protein
MDEFFAKDYKMKEETKFIVMKQVHHKSQRTKTLFAHSFRRRKKTTAANTAAENML